MVKTSVSKTEILKLIPAMIGYCIDETTGFPQDYKFATVKGSVIVPTTLDSNVLKLHQFLYGNTNYTPTQDVLNKKCADRCDCRRWTGTGYSACGNGRSEYNNG